jgi:hypothetical protein
MSPWKEIPFLAEPCDDYQAEDDPNSPARLIDLCVRCGHRLPAHPRPKLTLVEGRDIELSDGTVLRSPSTSRQRNGTRWRPGS